MLIKVALASSDPEHSCVGQAGGERQTRELRVLRIWTQYNLSCWNDINLMCSRFGRKVGIDHIPCEQTWSTHYVCYLFLSGYCYHEISTWDRHILRERSAIVTLLKNRERNGHYIRCISYVLTTFKSIYWKLFQTKI